MNLITLPDKTPRQEERYLEIVEKKGIGHPDSLADSLADAISFNYSQYCLKHFGHVLHHNVDKINVLGGSSTAGFGFGEQIEPIRIIVNGRLSMCFGDHQIPVYEIAENTAKQYMKKVIPEIDLEKGLKIYDFLNRAGGPPHKGGRWFKPQTLDDLPEIKRPYTADTSCIIGYHPLSKIEQLVLDLHDYFYPQLYTKRFSYIGTDIKIMAVRTKKNVHITMCVPFIGKLTPSYEFYIEQRQIITNELLTIAKRALGEAYNILLELNTKDDVARKDFYILAIGSAAESGDEGLVGRGNRSNGLITSHRPYSIEASFGKNPVYHGGKVFDYFVKKLSAKIYSATSTENVVAVIAQAGGLIKDPSEIIIEMKSDKNQIDSEALKKFTEQELNELKDVTKNILEDHGRLYGFMNLNE